MLKRKPVEIGFEGDFTEKKKSNTIDSVRSFHQECVLNKETQMCFMYYSSITQLSSRQVLPTFGVFAKDAGTIHTITFKFFYLPQRWENSSTTSPGFPSLWE